MKRCPFCAEEIQDAAIKCRYCGTMLAVAPPVQVVGPAPTAARKDDIKHLLAEGKKIDAWKVLLRERRRADWPAAAKA